MKQCNWTVNGLPCEAPVRCSLETKNKTFYYCAKHFDKMVGILKVVGSTLVRKFNL